MPTFAQIYAYEKKKWRAQELAQEPNAVETEEEIHEVEQGAVDLVDVADQVDYSDWSRSELYREAKSKGCELPWVGTSEDEFIEWLING